jgi:chromosomal replication initiator protein
MEEEMTATTISTWFDDAEAIALEENRFILYTPSSFKKEIIESRYLSMVKKALFELFSADFDIVVLTEGEREKYTPKTGTSRFLPGTEEYTFERFVVGNSNKFAHAAAVAVAENPAQSYNPLFIYGESGLGKTHLLYAIAHTIHAAHPDYRIVYIRGDSFTNELIQAIREGKNQEFREKYRSADVFLMDDVQFIAGRDSTQEEMFHTFNTLYEAKKQIVFTSDRPPKEMLRLEDRLKTRFEWGLLADIQPPDYETRMAIIKNKAIRMGVDLPEEVLTYVAENITANVRQIEGTVNKILAFRDLLGNSVDAGTVTRAVRDMFKDPNTILPSASVIIDEVCKFYSIEDDALRGQGRTKDTAQARQIAMYLIRNMTSLSLKEIGREFENRDHTTVLHSIDRIEKLKNSNPEIAEVLKDIKTNINAHYE